jgi:hypothetical protein
MALRRKTDITAMTQPRYTGIPTFMRAPAAADWNGCRYRPHRRAL